MRKDGLRYSCVVALVSLALAGCAAKKVPVEVSSNTNAAGVGGFGPGNSAGSAPGGFGNGNGNVGAGSGGSGGTGQLFRDANGNLVDANGNRVDEFGNPLGASAGGNGVFLDGNGNFVDANGNPVDANGNPISLAGAITTDGNGNFFDANGNPVDQFGNPLGTAQGGRFVTGPGTYNFAGDDGSPGYFAQRVGDRVLFDTDSSTLDAEGQEILRRQAAWFRQHPQYAVTIEGHADERGTRDYNLALGARRANATRSFLSSLGIDPNRIRTVSYGKERPIQASSTPGAWRINRRAVTTLRGGPSS